MGTRYPSLDQAQDPAVRQVLKLIFDKIGLLEAQAAGIGTVNQPLTTPLDAAGNRLTALADPTAPTDAVTLQFMQKWVEGRLLAATTPTPVPTPSGAPPAGTPGAQDMPIIAMSSNPAQIAIDVRASLAFFGYAPAADAYWVGKATNPEQFSNGKWYQGWNAYWEARASPGNTGSADPNLGDQPAVHT